MMTALDQQKLLIGTRDSGFYIYDGGKMEPFVTEADEYLKINQLSHGIRLESGDFALATRLGGLVIIDAGGRLKQIHTRDAGLLDDYVRYVHQDSQGNLWLALDKGIAKIEYHSPLSIIDDRCGLPGIVLSVVGHGPGNDIYTGTTRGLYRRISPTRHQQVPGMSAYCWWLLSTGDSLLAAADNGVFQVEQDNVRQVIPNPSYVLHHSRRDKNRVWVGTNQGLVSLAAAPNAPRRWQLEHKFANIDQDIRTIAEDNSGVLWLGTLSQGVIALRFPTPGRIDDYQANRCEPPAAGSLKEAHVFFAAGHVMIAAPTGISRWDEKNGRLVPDLTLGKRFASGKHGEQIFRIAEDNQKHIWFHSRNRNMHAIPREDGGFAIHDKPFLRIPRVQVNAIYPDPVENRVWFANNDGLICFDRTMKKNYRQPVPVYIRNVLADGRLVFDGFRAAHGPGPGIPFPIIPYEDRNLRFQFASPYFENETAVRFQSFLEGYDSGWSEWSSEPRKDYTNLDPGTYTFRVRAENIYREQSPEDAFGFRILPPWHQTWWAFVSYGILFFLLMYTIIRWRSLKLEREKERLEKVVERRTGEIRDKNRQLQSQTHQLEEQSEKLKEMDNVKSRFFANISHEFRTPLTLIMGPLEQMRTQDPDPRRGKTYDLMMRNSRRLLNLINQLLELSKIESGKMTLQAARQNLTPFLKGIVSSFETAATEREQELIFRAPASDIPLYFDAAKLEDVLLNLLSNAVKFTPPGGEIIVALSSIPGQSPVFPGGAAVISVSDTGPGIPGEQLEHIFDRFYQSDSTHEHHRKGSGIGLTIARELVELHRGALEVHSHEGKGTEFIVRLPLGDQHLERAEIVQYARPASGQTHQIEIPGSQPQPPAPSVEPAPPGKNIILVVEDSFDTRSYIRNALEGEYHVVEAADGDEGVRAALEIIPDLIVSDIMMPGTGGLQLCGTLKNDVKTSHIPIILLTAKAAEPDILQGLESGADDYILKPFSTRILSARIKNLIDLRARLQQTRKRDMTPRPIKIPASKVDNLFIKKFQVVIEENISDPEFNIEELCRKMDLSQPTMYRKISALFGESPTDYIRSYRLKRGARLLEENYGTVLEVALEVGFSSAAYFTKCFKKEFNRLPSTFQPEKSGGD
jgi:signal transduction histidine kinase/DNA-binding NarL/FixJ family response regulator